YARLRRRDSVSEQSEGGLSHVDDSGGQESRHGVDRLSRHWTLPSRVQESLERQPAPPSWGADSSGGPEADADPPEQPGGVDEPARHWHGSGRGALSGRPAPAFVPGPRGQRDGDRPPPSDSSSDVPARSIFATDRGDRPGREPLLPRDQRTPRRDVR